MKRLWHALLLAALSAHTQASPATASPDAEAIAVSLSEPAQERMGVESEALAERTTHDSVPAVIRTIDPGPLAMLDSDLAGATIAAASSDQELQRTSSLAAQDQSASQQALEAARAKAAADNASLTLLRRRLALEWSPAFGAMTAEQRSALVNAVAAGSAALLRADAPQHPEGIEGRVLVEATAGQPPIAADPLGLSGTADPRMQTIGLYCVVRGTQAGTLRPGRVFSGSIETGSKITGVVLPRSAIVRLDGSDWVYVRTGDESFERREVVDAHQMQDGWFVPAGFPPGTEVVVRGAGSLVALERKGPEGDEADED